MALSRSYYDEVGSVREYELIVILRPDTSSEDIKTYIKRISDVVEKKEGRILSIENWGRRKLAYEIRKERKGIYLYCRLLGYFELMPEVERILRMIENVIRYMTIVVDANVDPTARPAEFTDDMMKAASEIGAIEDDYDNRIEPKAEISDDDDDVSEDEVSDDDDDEEK